MLASCSETARRAMLVNKVEARIVSLLSTSTIEPHMQIWGLSVLSNLAVGQGKLPGGQAARNRQVAMLAALLSSHDPGVQHAAALHLATLSHSPEVRLAIARAPSAPLASLYVLEDPTTAKAAPPLPYARRLRDEALDYARLALRTPQGRHYKPAFDRRAFYAHKAQEEKGATYIQAEIRRWRAQAEYTRNQSRRTCGAVLVQKNVRRMQSRTSVQQLKATLHTAASRIGARIRGYVARKSTQSKLTYAKGTAEAAQAPAADELPIVRVLGLRLHNAEGKFMMLPLKIWAAPEPPLALALQLKPMRNVPLCMNIRVDPEAAAMAAAPPPAAVERAVCDGGAAQPPIPDSDGQVSPVTHAMQKAEDEWVAAMATSIANSAIATAIAATTKKDIDRPAALVPSAPVEVMDVAVELDPVNLAAQECARKAVMMAIEKALLPEGEGEVVDPTLESGVADQDA
mmetsp:Transcript_36523/g.117283  ORF Transcript_36523/g.117283 Transcript_36523/m.117283 type:complete len:458 (+) Transcript_36523:75-1448(+)